LDTKMM